MNEIVRHHNDFYKLNITEFKELEQNLLFGILVNCRDKQSVDFEIQADDLKRFVDRTNATQEQLFKLVDDLATKFFKLDFTRIKECPDGSKEKEIYNLFSRFTIKYYGKNDKDPNARLEKIILRVNSDFAYLLDELTNGFYTEFELEEFMFLRGKYPKTLYRLLRRFRASGEYYTTWENFKEQMGIPPSFSNEKIETVILKPCVEKLSQTFKTNLFDARIPFKNLTYSLKKEKSKRGKAQVSEIYFHFEKQGSCVDERQKYINAQKAKQPIIEKGEPKYITELKELCAKRKKYQVGDEKHELVKVVKNSNGDYELYYIKNGENLYKPLTYEIAKNYIQAPKEQKWL